MKKIIVLTCFSLFSFCQTKEMNNYLSFDETSFKTEYWNKLVRAITWVESRNNDHAFNKRSGALGRFQMKKIYVDEVNRILKLQKKKKRYKYADRTNPIKAREMFEIYQNHHNPNHNIDRAILLHRGLDSYSYRKAVKEKMK